MVEPTSHFGLWPAIKFLINFASAFFGLVGAWLMSRRYARQPVMALIIAIFWPLLALFRRGERVRNSVTAAINANRDVEDAVKDMALGLVLLFWAFVFQAIGLLIDLHQ